MAACHKQKFGWQFSVLDYENFRNGATAEPRSGGVLI